MNKTNALKFEYGVLIKNRNIGNIFNLLLFVKDCKYTIAIQSNIQIQMEIMNQGIENLDTALQIFDDYFEKLKNHNIIIRQKRYGYQCCNSDMIKEFYL